MTAAILRWMGGCLGVTVTAYYLIKALNAQLRNVEALTFTWWSLLPRKCVLVNVSLWPCLGPQTIGVGDTAYTSGILLILCLVRLGLWRDLLPWQAGSRLGWQRKSCFRIAVAHLG